MFLLHAKRNEGLVQINALFLGVLTLIVEERPLALKMIFERFADAGKKRKLQFKITLFKKNCGSPTRDDALEEAAKNNII